jgi:hypothetical protein
VKAEQFRSMLRGKRFHPLIARTASGESYAVNHPKAVWQSPEGGTVLVYLGGEGVVLIDTDEITDCVRING